MERLGTKKWLLWLVKRCFLISKEKREQKSGFIQWRYVSFHPNVHKEEEGQEKGDGTGSNGYPENHPHLNWFLDIKTPPPGKNLNMVEIFSANTFSLSPRLCTHANMAWQAQASREGDTCLKNVEINPPNLMKKLSPNRIRLEINFVFLVHLRKCNTQPRWSIPSQVWVCQLHTWKKEASMENHHTQNTPGTHAVGPLYQEAKRSNFPAAILWDVTFFKIMILFHRIIVAWIVTPL